MILLAATMVGCSDAEPIVVRQLQLSADGVLFDAAGGEDFVEVVPFPESEAWQVVCHHPQSWFSFRVEGNRLWVEAESNREERPRTGQLTLESPSGAFEAYRLAVSQEAAFDEFYFSTSAAEAYCFDSEGGVFSFDVLSNGHWSLTTEASWITLEQDPEQGKASISARSNPGEEPLSGVVVLEWGSGRQEIRVEQGTRAENHYLQLLGKWEITATKWFYSPNGSLNNLDYAPAPSEYYLIFDLEQGVYGESLYMRNFLYPGTSLEVRYDRQTGSIIIPFGWSVYSYEVFLYITCVGTSSFSYAAQEVMAEPSEDLSQMELKMPSVPGFEHVGFGLWCYDEEGNKIAFGSRAYPTLFPMGEIVFKKYVIK